MSVQPRASSSATNGSGGVELPLATADRRLRRRPGRPRTVTAAQATGGSIRSAHSEPAKDAAETPDFAATVPPPGWGRGLSLLASASYSGIPVRRLWALIGAGALPAIRVPGMRAVLVLRDDLDALLLAHRGARMSTPGEYPAAGPDAVRRPS